jgi:hypothetical protein
MYSKNVISTWKIALIVEPIDKDNMVFKIKRVKKG